MDEATLAARLRDERYFADDGLLTAVYRALTLGRPLLLEGEPGVGKTEIAAVLSRVLDRELVRLQCYEGLDAGQALYEWNYPRQLLALRGGVVDDETGVVEVLRMYSVYEIGRALNPAMATQQVEGGAWMGMSHALFEATEPYYPVRDHGPTDFSQYLMPAAGDIPEQTSVLLERPAPTGPYGAKGIGEMTANAPIPAIANAIFDACGVRMEHMPFTPERVLRGIDALRAGS